MLELREAVEEAATEGDREAMRGLWRENEERCRREEEFVGRALEEGRWEPARTGVGRWRYWGSLRGRLEELGGEGEGGHGVV